MPSLRKLSLESTRAIARNPNIDLKISVHLLKPDKQYLIRTPQCSLNLIQSRDNQLIETYKNSLKQQTFQTFTEKTTVNILKLVKIIDT